MAFTVDLAMLPQLIQQVKHTLRAKNPDYSATFAAMSASVQQEIAEIVALREAGEAVVPELAYADIATGSITQAQCELVQKRGCVVIRDTFPDQLAVEWNQEVGRYVEDNGFYETPDKGLDKYFSSLQSSKPQIISVYWSKPQIDVRQHKNMATTRRFLNRLWDYDFEGQQVFDPDRECSYADRTRRREPGDSSLGLKPHMDGGSVERWLDKDGFHQVYRHLINGNWQDYSPFAAAFRTQTQEIPSPAVCSMFRTFQGWTALTPQGPTDGTLQLIPSARVLGWMYLRALQDDVPEHSLCDAMPGRALQCLPQWHELVLNGLCSIPYMQPGDTVWWHPDVVHAVEDQHLGDGYSNVIYSGVAPYCAKNVTYLHKQRERFLRGESAPDFAAEHHEIAYQGRAGLDDLTALGKRQMGFQTW